jgi:hypothetical protein
LSSTATSPSAPSGLSRRGVLKAALGAGAVAVCPFTGQSAARAATLATTATASATRHSAFQRGLDVATKVGRTTEGRYGLMFKSLKAYVVPDDLLSSLAASMLDPREPQEDPSDHDEYDNHDITGGYTFLGQFLDHDMTRDTTPLAQAKADPRGTLNYDTPFLDLGSVYGRGPALDPQLYEADKVHLRMSYDNGIPDLPRDANGTAIIGDPRNDENLIVAQLHVGFLGFHNKLIDAGVPFATAQQRTRWAYQRLIVDQFLGRVVGKDIVNSMLKRSGDKHVGVVNTYYKPQKPTKPMMPIEYAAAAYRFGHSMIRPEYEMNDAHTRPVFSPDGDDLRGSRPIPAELHADWSYFFDVPGFDKPDGLNFSRIMDCKLAAGLHTLPDTVQKDGVANLAERNLLRGARVGVPAGQDVALKMGLKPLTNAQLGLTDKRWNGKAPLWYYLLKESEIQHNGRRLGAVGGRIVAETILGILALDKTSYLYAPGGYVPEFPTLGDFLLAAGTGRHMGPKPPEAPEEELPEAPEVPEEEAPDAPEAPEAVPPADQPVG